MIGDNACVLNDKKNEWVLIRGISKMHAENRKQDFSFVKCEMR